MTESALDTTTARRALDAFLVDNQELEQLNARLSASNLFNVLRIDHVEIRHSNVLAWLLTPGESHGLGPTFLRRFLSRLLMDNDGAAVSLSPAQVELMKFNDVEVQREWQKIDILAHSPDGGWCLLIENKIHSSEGKGQLVRYLDRVKKRSECRSIASSPSCAAVGSGSCRRSWVNCYRTRISPDGISFLAPLLSDAGVSTTRGMVVQAWSWRLAQ